MSNVPPSKSALSSVTSKSMDRFLAACIDSDALPEEAKEGSIHPVPVIPEIRRDEPGQEEVKAPKSAAWKKAETALKGRLEDMCRRLKEVEKGLHNNGKVSELAVELVSCETTRQMMAGKVRDLSGKEATINVHPRAAKAHWERLKPGAVLVLKSVTVFAPSSQTHCLIVLHSNIQSIFTP